MSDQVALWLRRIPDKMVQPHRRGTMRPRQCLTLEQWLRDSRLPRPTLWELEQLRLYRGHRRHLDGPRPWCGKRGPGRHP